MKRIIFNLLSGVLVLGISSCEDKINNDDFDIYFAPRFNQELKWNPDSLSFMRAEWHDTPLSNGLAVQQTTVKMWDTNQTVTRISYQPSLFVTRVAKNSGKTSMDAATSAEGSRLGISPLFAVNFSSPSLLVVDGETLVEEKTSSKVAALCLAEVDGEVRAEIINCTNSDFDILKSRYNNVLAGGTMLVNNGSALSQPESSRCARTVLGVDGSGKITMLVIDANTTGNASGATLAEAALIARVSGMKQAMSIDNGNAAGNLLWTKQEGIVNTVSYPEPGSSLVYVVLSTPFGGGDGTAENPYRISARRHMLNMASVLKDDETLYFNMTADVDLAGVNWTPLNAESPYKKRVVFNGNGHTIANFTCSANAYPSMFGVLYGECRNVKFENVDIQSLTNSSAGAVGGYVGTGGLNALVDQVVVTGKISASTNCTQPVGGICGQSVDGIIRNCRVDVTLSRESDPFQVGLGGVIGKLRDRATVENCFAEGTVTGKASENVGAIAGKGDQNAQNWTFKNNIAWTTKLTGVWSSNRVMGRYWTTNNAVGRNFARKDMVLYLNRDGKWGADPYISTGNNTTCPGDDAEDPIKAAKDLGWDNTVWNLSGAMPRLKWEK